jgi:hypothetical protein
MKLKHLIFTLLLVFAAPFANVAKASEFGCTVLLCLANPASNGGPTGVAECVQPINQLYKDLLKGKPFPSCDLADGNDGTSYAKLVNDPFDPCPDGLAAVAADTWVAEGVRNSKPASSYAEGYDLTQGPKQSGDEVRACVGKVTGAYRDTSTERDVYTKIMVYDEVIWQKASSPRAIDVYIDNTFQHRVHY